MCSSIVEVVMSDLDLTPEEIALVRDYVEIPPGVAVDRLDVQRARLAKAVGGWFRKTGPGLYQIVTEAPRSVGSDPGSPPPAST